MNLRVAICAAVAVLLPHGGVAQLLEFPSNATQLAANQSPLDSYNVPSGPYSNGAIQTLPAEGQVTQQAWRIPVGRITTLQVMEPLREQLLKSGFDVIFECKADTCGGFDFRYHTDVLPEPFMHVDLGDYRFLSARRIADNTSEYISILVSRSSIAAFVQVMRVGPPSDDAPALVSSTKSPIRAPVITPESALSMVQALEETGSYVLDDLTFETGSSSLGAGTYATLAALADYLNTNPDRRVVLVGHTDSEGSLEGNTALSKKRATSVVERLVETYGVRSAQLGAEGVGYLSPRASNLSDDGRTQNRRVEVILTSTR